MKQKLRLQILFATAVSGQNSDATNTGNVCYVGGSGVPCANTGLNYSTILGWDAASKIENSSNSTLKGYQAVAEVLPEVVNTKGKFYTMQYALVTALLVEAIKEQQTLIDRQEEKIHALQQELSTFNALKSGIERLERQYNNMKTLQIESNSPKINPDKYERSTTGK